MPNEFVRSLAELLKPKSPPGTGANDVVERLMSVTDYINMTDSLAVTTSAPSRLVGTARVGYSECA